jgi:Tfp pilus assembly protein PilE
MDLTQIIAVIMVVTILATITLAAVAYAAFRLRERRAPDLSLLDSNAPVFFERVRFFPQEPARRD